MVNPWFYCSGYVVWRRFYRRIAVVCEEVPVLKDVEIQLDKLSDKVRDDGIREVIYGRKAERQAVDPGESGKCLWCKELVTTEGRRYFCCDECEVDWLKRAKRLAELEENPGVGSGG